MGTHFTLALGLTKSESKKKTKKSAKNKMKLPGRINLGIVLALLLAILSAAYLFSVNTIATKGYEIRQLETRLTQLKESNKRLELEAAGLKSIQNVEENARKLNLVPSTQVRHLSDSEYAFSAD